LIKQKPGFSGKMFWSLEIPFKTGFTVHKITITITAPFKNKVADVILILWDHLVVRM